jgi:hypothetical protein
MRMTLPGSQKALKTMPPSKNPPSHSKEAKSKYSSRKRTISDEEKDQIIAYGMFQKKPRWIADRLKVAVPTVEKVLENSKNDDKAPYRAQLQAALCSEMYDKIKLMIDAIDESTVKEHLKQGKLKDVAISIGIISQRRGELLKDLQERLGVDHLKTAEGIDDLLKGINRGFKIIDAMAKRKDAKEKASKEIPVDASYKQVS